MAVWTPPADQLGKNEHVGRRLFEEPALAGSPPGKVPPRLDYRHFEETRGQELSLDRLGQTGIDKRVVQYLLPRAVSQGDSFRPTRNFTGWYAIKADVLIRSSKGPRTTLTASPITVEGSDGRDLTENRYHAHAKLPDADPYMAALHLRELFESKGMSVPRPPQIAGAPRPRLRARLVDIARELLAWATRR